MGPGLSNTNWGPGLVNTNWGPGLVNKNWRPGPGAGTLSENYKPIKVWLCLVYKFFRELLSLATFLRVHSNSEEVSYLS